MEKEGEGKSHSAELKGRRPRNSNARKRTQDEVEDNDEGTSASIPLADLLEIQKLRKRQHGITVENLTAGHIEALPTISSMDGDVEKMRTGGMVTYRTAKAMAALPSQLESGGQHIDIGTEFSAETQRRDEDYDMMKFIEDEIAKRKTGVPASDGSELPASMRQVIRPEDALLVVAENFKRETGKKSEEMLSHQMLSGIPEVDLGIEAKIKNIEATEEAKRRLMAKLRAESPETRQSKLASTEAGERQVVSVLHARYNMEMYSREAQPEAAREDIRSLTAPRPDTCRRKGEEDPVDAGSSADIASYEIFKNLEEKKEKKPKRRK
ncbi:hypothetical protein RvY_04836 [Ramazzottius varieornatus]|uniref:Uncharacterized protein n=1 Tax=Ramazzottius varieornatus TaxID=947166 RepID=A0A1D1UT07_RAMVA|nr:hypothetical protein RvY_04836 [Ramazzottius varieornatus]